MNPQLQQQSTRRRCKVSKDERGLLRLGDFFLSHVLRAVAGFSMLWLFAAALSTPCAAQTAVLSSAAGGFAISGPIPLLPIPTYHAGFGNVNGLGVGTPATGVTALAVSGGEFYYTPINFIVAGANAGHPAVIWAYMSTSFSNSSSVLQLMSCPSPGPCTSFSNYSAVPNTQASEIVVLPQTTSTGTFTAYLGLFVGSVNGIPITSSDSATVMFDVRDDRHGLLSQVELQLDTPNESVQTAVRLQLGTATGGLAVTARGGTPDYQGDFGTVNGLGIGPAAGLTIVTGQVAGGSLYTTPYLVEPQFSGFSAANNTTITVYLSTNFVHSAVLNLYDSSTSGSGYSLISTSSGAQTQITSAAGNGTNITRYLGLFVSNANGAGSFTGSDSATLTYTITVQ